MPDMLETWGVRGKGMTSQEEQKDLRGGGRDKHCVSFQGREGVMFTRAVLVCEAVDVHRKVWFDL